MEIFQNLPAEDLETIARILRERRLAEGDVLFRQGEAGDAMFIVTGGRIRLWTADTSGNETTLAHLTDGQLFGETALLTGAPRSSTATADTESRVLVLPRADFDALLATNAPIVREMLRVVSQRTVQVNQQLIAEEVGSASSAGGGKVYLVFSPRGGAGKTTVAVNLAVALARLLPERVALFDLDLTFGHAALLLNLEAESSLAAASPERLEVLDRRTLGQHLIRHACGLHVLPGALRAEEGEMVTGEHVRAALGVMKRQFAATVVDCGVSFSDPILAAAELADRVLLLCTPELNTLRDVRACQRVFAEVLRLEKARVWFVLNHHQPFKLLTREQFESALEQPITFELPHAGEAAVKAELRGEPLVTLATGSPFARSIERLALALAPAEGKAARATARNGPALAAPGANRGAHTRPKGVLRLFRRG